MIFIDKNFRFYDDSKDLETFPELKPTPEAVALTDDEVTAITADITKWRWHPADLKPYKIPDCDKKYWKTVDGVILEMTAEEKAAVDKAEADALAAKQAEEQAAAEAAAQAQAELEAKMVEAQKAKDSVVTIEAAVEKAADLETLRKNVLELVKAVKVLTA
jgi:predicted  nucleic acid-binding Zn-ribbon protein